MKCTGLALTAMIGFAYAAPVEQQSWTEPGGDHKYKSLARRRIFPKFTLGRDEAGRRIVDPIRMMVASTIVSVAALPLGARFYNAVFGVQEPEAATRARERVEKDAADAKAEKEKEKARQEKARREKEKKGGKRSIDVDVDVDAGDLDLTFDKTRKLYISTFVDTLFQQNPNGGETDAAVCTGVGYKISDPSKTLEASEVKFTGKGQEYVYDCFVLAGPVTFEVNNATDADFVWEARTGATFSNGVLTIV